MMKFIFLHADKHRNLLQGDTIIPVYQGMPKVPKISLHIFGMFP